MIRQFAGREPTGGELLDFLSSSFGIDDLPIRTGSRMSMTEDSPADIEICSDHIFLAFPPERYVMEFDPEEFSSE